MRFCNLTLRTPEENLALDEALLDMCEAGYPHSILRFWQPTSPFVVVGYANKVAAEVNVPACAARNIPILRRCTGGGTVLQSTGCLNYTVILRINSHPLLSSVSGTNKYVMERNRQAVQDLLGKPVQLEGHTDLAINGRKFCGNAQRRRRYWLIFHGCFLLDCDLALMEDLLLMPSHRPEYRQNRAHADFVMNLPASAGTLKEALQSVWSASIPLASVPIPETDGLVRDKYSRHDWNFKF